MSTISVNVSAVADVNPYVFPAGLSAVNGAFKVVGGVLKTTAPDILAAVLASSPVTSGLLDVTLQTAVDSTVFYDSISAIFSTPTGNGYSVEINGDHIYVYPLTAFSAGSNVSVLPGLSYTAGAFFRFTFDISTGTLNIYQNSISATIPALTVNSLTYVSGMSNGAGSSWSDSNSAGIISFSVVASLTSIDSITSGGNPGFQVGQPFSINTTGLGTLASTTFQTIGLSGSTITTISLSAVGGDGTGLTPFWVDGQKYAKPGTVSTIATDSVPSTATANFTLALPDNYIDVLFASVILSDPTYLGYALNAIGRPLADNDAAYWPNVNSLTFSAAGKISVDLPPASTMTSDLWIQKVDGTMQNYTIVINSEGQITSTSRITSSLLTSRNITSRFLTARL